MNPAMNPAMNTVEHQLAQAAARPQRFGAAARPQRFGGEDVSAPLEAARLDENLLAIHAELDAPLESRLARLLRRLGVPDLTVPLITATPALRRSWFAAVAIAIMFALSVANNNDSGAGVDQIVVFLTMAPLVPLLGVALAFGRGVDPTHDLVLAAPRDTFTVFLIRAVTVLVASSAILLVSSALLPTGGAYRAAWLLPAVALSALMLAAAGRFEPRRVAGGLAAGWVGLVVTVASATSSEAMFGPITQAVAVVAAALAAGLVLRGRDDFDRGEVPT